MLGEMIARSTAAGIYLKISDHCDEKANSLRQRDDASSRRAAPWFASKAAELDQVALSTLLHRGELGPDETLSNSKTHVRYLGRRVWLSSYRLVQTPNPHSRTIGLSGIGLLSSCDIMLFYGSSKLSAVFGRTLDGVRELNNELALNCLDRFKRQCVEFTRAADARRCLLSWINTEQKRILGQPVIQPLTVSELPGRPEPHPCAIFGKAAND